MLRTLVEAVKCPAASTRSANIADLLHYCAPKTQHKLIEVEYFKTSNNCGHDYDHLGKLAKNKKKQKMK